MKYYFFNMKLQPRFETLREKKLVGQHLTMSLANNLTAQLWARFMPLRKIIQDTVNTSLYSLQIYPTDYFQPFNPANTFVKWAAVEVSNFENVPAEMETLIVPSGEYVVFHYKGDSRNGAEVFRYIFSEWLPQSGYVLDHRPHFELLGEKYKNESADSEEEIWIPVKKINV